MNRKRYIKNLLLLNIPLILATTIYLILFFTVFKGGEVSLCFLKENFNLYCPGCGGSRALVSLVKFDLIESFLFYPPLLVAVLIILELDIRMFLCVLKNTDSYMKKYSFKRFYILAFFIIASFLVRNALLLFFNIDFLGDIHQ